MNIDIRNLKNLSYEKPNLKKYGTMKEITFGSGGSRNIDMNMLTGNPRTPRKDLFDIYYPSDSTDNIKDVPIGDK